jgi:DNA-binding LacI/PurR family transcriptional regulator
LAVDHLVKSKRQVIAFLAGPEGAYASRERLRGFIQAMKNAGRFVNPSLIVPYNANLEDGYRSVAELLQSEGDDLAVWNEARTTFGCRGTRQLLEQHPEVDGLVCFDDQLAFGALRACAERGRRVPDDIAIVGCNDMPLASQVTPALTTQRVPGFQMGVRAAQILIERIQGREPQDPIIFPHQLIIRASAPAISHIAQT